MIFSSDNSTPHLSSKYDMEVRNTIPYYDYFHEESLELVFSIYGEHGPSDWLDTGCGTGTMVEKAIRRFPDTRFILADPSAEMLMEAQKKLNHLMDRLTILNPVATQNLPNLSEVPEVITAIQAHHYLEKDARRAATKKCYDLLKKSGLYITFENVRPFTVRGTEIGKKYWKDFQIRHGRDLITAEKHMERFGKEYFPITVEEHLRLYRDCGFECVELFWYSYLQAGFYCIK